MGVVGKSIYPSWKCAGHFCRYIKIRNNHFLKLFITLISNSSLIRQIFKGYWDCHLCIEASLNYPFRGCAQSLFLNKTLTIIAFNVRKIIDIISPPILKFVKIKKLSNFSSMAFTMGGGRGAVPS